MAPILRFALFNAVTIFRFDLNADITRIIWTIGLFLGQNNVSNHAFCEASSSAGNFCKGTSSLAAIASTENGNSFRV